MVDVGPPGRGRGSVERGTLSTVCRLRHDLVDLFKCAMVTGNARAIRGSGLLALVVAAHLLLLLTIASSLHSQRRKARTAPPEIEAFILPLANQQISEPPPPTSRPSHRRPLHSDVAEQPISNSGEPNDSNVPGIPDEVPNTPKFNPQLDIQLAVQALLPSLVQAEDRRCAEAERTHAPRPFGCKQRYYDKHLWQPSGNFLKDIRDPERPHGGTPDPLPDAFAKAPRPEAFKPE